MAGSVAAQARETTSAYLYALLDPAISEAVARQVESSTEAGSLRIYEGKYSGHALASVDPVLVAIKPHEVADVCRTCQGLPLLGFLVTPLVAAQLQDHLRRLAEVSTADGGEFMLRWADARALPAIHAALDAQQQASFMAPITSWWYFDRQGQPAVLRGNALEQQGTGPLERLHLSAEQVASLQRAMLPDLLLDYLHDRPHIYGRLDALDRASRCHMLAVEVLAGLQGKPSVGAVHDTERLNALREALAQRGWLS